MTQNRTKKSSEARLARRKFVKSLGLFATAISVPTLARSAQTPERRLAFRHLHTGEKLKRTYWASGRYLPESLDEINWLLRDFRTGEQYSMDLKLLDRLHGLRLALNLQAPFEIISGYRSPKTNEMLRTSSSGVAKKSYHMTGQALDIRVPGVPLERLYQAALAQRAGGVGLYTGSDFIHIDTGPVRAWGS